MIIHKNGTSIQLRTKQTFELKDSAFFKEKLLQWAQQFQEVIWLDSNKDSSRYATYDNVLAADAFTAIKTDSCAAFEKLQEYQEQAQDWIFGYLSYDLKNDLEDLSSANADGLHFPELYFFQPKKLFFFNDDQVEFCYLRMVDDEIETDFKEIMETEISLFEKNELPVKTTARIAKADYIKKVEEMLQHLHRGDIYEANFCQEFFAENTLIDPLETFKKLNEISSPPFAAFLKLEEFYALSASPERYIKRMGDKVISQPIKGTARRSANDDEDRLLAENLKNDPKEIAENVMIVDLVRNDLSRTTSKKGVKVEELCKVYSFKQVHQLISTISSEVEQGTSSVDVLKTTFPMGSMTGAPKVSAMKIIEELEESKRGLYSGAIGYFSATGDFDFNVVIRSVLYNAAEKYVSVAVGGAITTKSIPEKEYEECLLKSRAMRESLFAYQPA